MTDGPAEHTQPSAPAAAGHAEHYDPAAGKLGMWLFLFTEALLFGTMFIAFATYLHKYTWMFREGSHHLSRPIGAINTAILLTSSLFIALSIADAIGLDARPWLADRPQLELDFSLR